MQEHTWALSSIEDNTMSNEGGLGVGECKLVGGRFEYPPNQG
jgi:hypothetical protein